MTVWSMSKKELDRAEVLQRVVDRRLSVTDAAEVIGLTRRQTSRLLVAYRTSGTAGLMSKRRGKPSNRRHTDAFRGYVLGLVRERYHDFGPTLAAEKLVELHDVTMSRETLRKWMIEDGLWESRTERKKRVQQPRQRRARFGELVQIDGSLHWWFEDRGPKCALLVFIDDATGRILHLRFCPSESTFDYLQAAKASIDRYGKPLAYYSDRHSIFRTAKAATKTRGYKDGMTQFGRALDELNVDIICANSPQAKGRVERANRTLQDRLVKELRLQGVATIEAANAMVPSFVDAFNAKFARQPYSDEDAHRPLAPYDSLDGAMCVKSQRTVSHALTLRYDQVLFILEPNDISAALARKRVTVCDYPDGRLEIEHEGVALPYTTFDKVKPTKRAEVVENKRLDDVLSIMAQIAPVEPRKRSQAAPKRRGQANHMFTAEAAP